jgi:hypothetical protein
MKKAIIALAALAITGTAVAGPSWTYVDAGYARASSGNEDTDGYSLTGSFGLNRLHARLSILDAEIAGGKSSGGQDTDGYALAIGFHPALSDTTDLVLEVIYSDFDVDTASSSASGDSYALKTGVRTMWTDALELSAGVSAVNGSVSGCNACDSTDIEVNAGGQYLFTDNIGVGVDVINGGNNGNVANFYARFSF